MKIDSAIQAFSEKYSREAISSIDEISRETGLIANRYKIGVFNIQESFDIFQEYLRGYANYKVENANNPEASTQQVIRESVKTFIDTNIFKEEKVGYDELPNFVKSYIDGIISLAETVQEVKSTLADADIEMEAVGDVNDFTDMFMDKLQESFDPAMDKILGASGYTARQRLMNRTRMKVAPKPVFL